MTALTVTAVVVSFNQQRWLAQALASVTAQTHRPDHVVVVDDGSTDESHATISAWTAEHRPDATLLLRQDNRGVVRTLNEAFGHVTSTCIAPLAADDLWLPNKLAIQVPQLASLPPKVGVLYGDVPCMDEDGHPLEDSFITTYKGRPMLPEGDLFSELLAGNFLPSPSLLLRTECWTRVGGFDEALYMEDWDFWLRVAQHYSFAVTQEPVGSYRVVAGSHVRTPGARMSENHLATLRKWDRTPELRSAEGQDQLRRLAATLYRTGQRPRSRPRNLALWLRYGGWRELLRGGRP